jgi:murein DD-endopeptidase MepM/ murein hydrolase activator NlpD
MIPWPVKKWKNAGWNTKAGWFGEKRKTHTHNGVDLNSNLGGSSDLGAPVYSTHDGKVSQVKVYTDHKNGGGTMVYIEAPDGSFRTVYMHLNTATVKAGDVIKEGQQIGTVGGTGFGKERGQAVHLHYEIHKKVDGEFEGIDPENGTRGGELLDPQLWIEETPSEVAEEPRDIEFNATTIKAAPEQSFFEKAWGAVKSALGLDEPYYDDSFFDTMDRYEEQKANRGKN